MFKEYNMNNQKLIQKNDKNNKNKSTFNGGQINIKSFISNKDQLINNMSVNKIDFILLCETRIMDTKTLNLGQYSLYNKGRIDNTGGGVGILINNRNKVEEIITDDFSPIEIIILKIKVEKKVFHLASIYIPPQSATVNTVDIKRASKKMFDKLDNLENLIAGGDFNAHHTLWNSYKVNTFGKIIEENLNDSQLILLNNGKESTFISRPGTQSGIIDLTITTQNLFSQIKWKVTLDQCVIKSFDRS
jgi:hypothetical protein